MANYVLHPCTLIACECTPSVVDGGQCFSVLRSRDTDVMGDSSGRSYVTEQGHNVPLLRTSALGGERKPSSHDVACPFLQGFSYSFLKVCQLCFVRLIGAQSVTYRVELQIIMDDTLQGTRRHP